MSRKPKAPAPLAPELGRLFAEAVRRHRAGQFAEAERFCRQVLSIAPRHADSHYLLGTIAAAAGRHDLATGFFGKAIAINANNPSYHYELGHALWELGQTRRAVECYRRTHGLIPEDAAVLNTLGAGLQALGQLDQAGDCFRRALGIAPLYQSAHYNLGTVLLAQGKADAAAGSFNTAVGLRPDDGAALVNLGSALKTLGRLEEAAIRCRQALAIQPDLIEAHINLGSTLWELGQGDEALACFRRAIQLDPASPQARYNLGKALAELGQSEEAIPLLRRAIAAAPDHIDAYITLGIIFHDLGRRADAEQMFRGAVERQPTSWRAQMNLGCALLEQGRLDEAAACLRRAVDLSPDAAEARLNLAHALLVGGNFAAGLEGYEWRWRCGRLDQPPMPEFGVPLWSGEPGCGRTILLWAEQGAGDTLQFVRYAPLVAERGWQVVVQVPVCLKRIIATISGVSVITVLDPRPEIHAHCSLLSLPRLSGTTVETIPDSVPYLAPDPGLTEQWRDRLAGLSGLKVGISWRGNPAQRRDRSRSMTAELAAGALSVPGLAVVSLQADAWPDELACLGPAFDAGPLLTDYAETAAVIANLDLVISVCTSVCHLAGAMAIPTWTMLDFAADWRWLKQRSDSPWYPTMRLFRQPEPGDWSAVVEEVRAELAGLVPRGLHSL